MDVKSINVQELKKKLDQKESIQIIDIRDPREFYNGHIDTAICIPIDEIEDSLNKITADIPVIVYCTYGMKSTRIARLIMNKTERNDIFVLEDGLYQWQKEIDPEIFIL